MPSAVIVEPGRRGKRRLAPAIPPAPIWRLAVWEYHEMLQAGILKDGDPIELLEGWLVEKMTEHPPHSLATELVHEQLNGVISAKWHVRGAHPVTTEDSEPEPDATVVRGKRRDYKNRHPAPKDIGLMVEVADSSLELDRGIKQRIYARARIPVYWIINLIDDQVEVYTDPTGPSARPRYRKCKIFGRADEVPVVLDGQEVGRIAVRELLP
jgi:Uma2 family endonuclease